MRVTIDHDMHGVSADISPIELVAELHRRQGEMYAGGSIDPVVELLARDIIWHVPGRSPIAGDHRGIAQVVDYFERRRSLANATMRMRPGEVIWEGNAVAQFVESSVTVNVHPGPPCLGRQPQASWRARMPFSCSQGVWAGQLAGRLSNPEFLARIGQLLSEFDGLD